jgi:hypothetical protein
MVSISRRNVMLDRHTPGEWRHVVRRDGSIYLTMGNPERGAHSQFDWLGTEADAALAMAAPAMMAALEKARVSIELWSPDPTEPLEEIDAAIAKARGEDGPTGSPKGVAP